MLMGHLMWGLLGGLAAVALAMAAGAPAWAALLLYMGGSSLGLLLGVALQLLTARERPERQPAATIGRAAELRPVRVTR